MSDIPERWTQARVYPDMWTDPDQDPRNSDGVSPDGELATLQDYVRGWRAWINPDRPDRGALPSGRSGSTASRSTPATAATPTSSANASTAG
jgi:hypothetical protein